jgi:hypothetical protein
MLQTPVAVGLFLCEAIIVEEQTNNITPVNCFTLRAVETVPSKPGPFVVFALLTDGMGAGTLELVTQYLGSETLDLIYRVRLPVNFASPLQTVRCIVRPRDCVFPATGFYQAVLLADGLSIAQRKSARVMYCPPAAPSATANRNGALPALTARIAPMSSMMDRVTLPCSPARRSC